MNGFMDVLLIGNGLLQKLSRVTQDSTNSSAGYRWCFMVQVHCVGSARRPSYGLSGLATVTISTLNSFTCIKRGLLSSKYFNV